MWLLPGLTPDAFLRLRGVVTGRADWRALCHSVEGACDRLQAPDGIPAESRNQDRSPAAGRGPEIRHERDGPRLSARRRQRVLC